MVYGQDLARRVTSASLWSDNLRGRLLAQGNEVRHGFLRIERPFESARATRAPGLSVGSSALPVPRFVDCGHQGPLHPNRSADLAQRFEPPDSGCLGPVHRVPEVPVLLQTEPEIGGHTEDPGQA